jgi:hypothetical protein
LTAEVELSPDTLLPFEQSRVRLGARGLRLPEEGGRLRVQTGQGSVSLDLWEGESQGLSVDDTRTLTIAASILALASSRRQRR